MHGRDVLISYVPKYSMIVAENRGFSSRNYLGLFLADLGLFCHFLPGLGLSRSVPSLLWSLGQREQAWVRGCSATVNNAWNELIMNINMDKIAMEITRYKTEKYHLHSCKQWRIAAIFQLYVQDEHKQIFFSSLEAFTDSGIKTMLYLDLFRR